MGIKFCTIKVGEILINVREFSVNAFVKEGFDIDGNIVSEYILDADFVTNHLQQEISKYAYYTQMERNALESIDEMLLATRKEYKAKMRKLSLRKAEIIKAYNTIVYGKKEEKVC